MEYSRHLGKIAKYISLEDGEKHFKRLGATAYGVPARTQKDAQRSEIAETVDKASVIYLSGGDPGYLLDVMKDSFLWKKIQEKYQSGTILAGSSAVAMLLGGWLLTNIYQVFEGGGEVLHWEKAMGVVPYTIWPHFDFGL